MKALPPKNPRAFTLLELLIVMVLVAIMAAVSYNGIIGARDPSRLNSSTDVVIGMIQPARNHALSDMQFEVAGTCNADYYYVSFDDLPAITVEAYLADCGGSAYQQELASEEIMEEIGLEITLEDGSTYTIPEGVPPSNTPLLNYTPPLAETGWDEEITITLSTENGLLTKTIIVYPVSGLPELVTSSD